MVIVLSFQKLKETRSNILSSSSSEYTTEASFDFYTTIVSLDVVSNKDIDWLITFSKENVGVSEGSLDLDYYKKAVKIMSLAIHEYTHYLDCTATVWGFNYISLMRDAYHSNTGLYPDVKESEYHKAINFHRHLRFIRLPSYYTLVKKSVSTSGNWSYLQSVGNRYDANGFVSDHPILFITFLNSDNEVLVRSPMSALSVLECSAMANEVVFKVNAINQLEGSDSLELERNIYNSELSKYLHDSEITEYSVCAHLVSSKLGIEDTYQVFLSCSILCRFVLNATQEVFDHIYNNFDFCEIFEMEGNDVIIEKVKKGISLGEVGFLFYILCLVFQKKKVVSI